MTLDKYEQDILQSVENEEWQSKNNLNERLQELQSFIKNQKKKAISINRYSKYNYVNQLFFYLSNTAERIVLDK